MINRKIGNTAIGHDVAEVPAVFELPGLESTVCQRIVFAEAVASGTSVFEMKESDGKSAFKIQALVDEIFGKFDGRQKI